MIIKYCTLKAVPVRAVNYGWMTGWAMRNPASQLIQAIKLLITKRETPFGFHL
jgi:hypothetical protein